MKLSKKYLHDKSILLLLTSNLMLALLSVALIFLRLNNGRAGIYIVQRRANLGIDQYTQGGISTMIGFLLFTLLIVVGGFLISYKSFNDQKHVSVGVLCFSLLLIICTIVVSNSLLAMH
jgi:hypothetical protein